MPKRTGLQYFLYATLIEGLSALFWLLMIPSDAKSAWILGLSKSRLALFVILLLGILITIFLIVNSHRNVEKYKQISQKMGAVFQKKTLFMLATTASISGFTAGVHLIVSAYTITDEFIQGYLLRLAPLAFWLAAICANLLIATLILNTDRIKHFFQNRRKDWGYLLIVLIISLLVFNITNISIAHWDELAHAAEGVIDGTPHWRAFSNRLLGPYSVLFISHLGFPFETSLQIFNFLLITLQNFILFYLVLHYTGGSHSKSIRYLIIFSFMLISVEDYIMYTWDYIDTIIFTLFAFGIFQSKPTRFFAILFAVELLNREIALFIAFFILLDAFITGRSKNGILPKINFTNLNRQKLAVGLSLSAVGVVFIKAVRDLLFIESTVPGVGTDLENKLIGNHIQILENIRILFIENFTSLEIVNTIILIGVIVYLILLFPNFKLTHYQAFIIAVSMVLSIFIFGLINETRLYRYLVPFMLFFHLELGHHFSLKTAKNNSQ